MIPMAALAWAGLSQGATSFWQAITQPETLAALQLTIVIAAIVAVINAVMGTLIAWVLVRYRFPGRGIVDGLIDLPFALPTIVAGLTLLALYGPNSPFGVNIGFTRTGIAVALLLVTLPFVVRAVQPLLREADLEAEQAAASLGASPAYVFRRIIFPGIRPGIFSGCGLAFARAIGEFGAVVLIAGNLPFETKMSSVDIFGLIEQDQPEAAAAVSLVLLVISIAALAVFDYLERRSARGLG
jgi:sulfate transport system permease protein